MKEQLLKAIEQQLKETQHHDYIYVSRDYDEELDEGYDEWYLVAKETNGTLTEIFLWEDGEAHFQQRQGDYFNEHEFASVEAFAKYWAVFSTGLTR